MSKRRQQAKRNSESLSSADRSVAAAALPPANPPQPRPLLFYISAAAMALWIVFLLVMAIGW